MIWRYPLTFAVICVAILGFWWSIELVIILFDAPNAVSKWIGAVVALTYPAMIILGAVAAIDLIWKGASNA